MLTRWGADLFHPPPGGPRRPEAEAGGPARAVRRRAEGMAAAIAGHASTRTTQLYDRRRELIEPEEIERVQF